MGKRNRNVAEVEVVEADVENVDFESIEDGAEVSAIVADIEIEEARAEAHAAQESHDGEEISACVDVSADEPVATTEPAAAKPKKVKAPRVPRVSMTAGAKASAVIASIVGSNLGVFDLSGAAIDDADLEVTRDAVLAKIDTLDKKSREKAVNAFGARVKGAKPSTYTMQALEALAVAGEMKLSDLVAFYRTKYQEGTARRQASEMFAVFPVLGIATKEPVKGSPLVFNRDSTFAKAFLGS